MEESLKKANAALFQVKAELIDLQAENKTLKLQEQDDRQKIQHLLALTQPITEQVTFFRDCRPGTRTTYPSGRAPTPTTYPYPSTMHIGSEDMQERRKKKKQQQSSFVVRGNAPSLKNINQGILPSKVLRTVYMPNEQTAALTKTIENLQKQLESHQELTETRIQVGIVKRCSGRIGHLKLIACIVALGSAGWVCAGEGYNVAESAAT